MARILIYSGAGLSAESGIPTFRDPGGIWDRYKFDEVCDYRTWRVNYAAVHAFHNEFRAMIADKQPNAAHHFYAELARSYDVMHFTQNGDDLLERAGHPLDRLIHIHGDITKLKCMACAREWSIGYEAFDCEKGKCKCGCKRAIKPHTVLFNEEAPLYRKLYKAIEALKREDLVIVVGTQGAILNPTELFRKTRSRRILNNLHPHPEIDPDFFVAVHYAPATEAIGLIAKDIEAAFATRK